MITMFGLTLEDEALLHEKIAWALLLQSAPVFLVLMFVIPAPWGKTVSHSIGPLLPAKMSWFFFECPNLVWCAICYWVRCCCRQKEEEQRQRQLEASSRLLLTLFFLHYAQRAVLYPLLMSRNTTKMPLTVVLVAFVFTFFNG